MRLEGSAGQVLEALGSCWKELSAKGNGDPREALEPGKVRISLASVSWALLAGVHSGPPSPPPPHAPQGPTHQWHQLPLLHDFRQHLAPGRARADLGPQEVPGGEVGVAVLLDNLLTLGALPRAGPACKRPPHSEAPRNRAPAGTGSARGHPAKWGQSPGCSPRAQAPPHPRACPVCCRARLPWTHPPQR